MRKVQKAMGDMRKVNEAFTMFQQTKQKHYIKYILADESKLTANALVSYHFHNF